METVEDHLATLREHMTRTYLNLRIGIALIGGFLPVVLWAGGALTGQTLLSSMSAYYNTSLRDLFVGAIVSVGVFLYLYKGFSRKENWALNLAGGFAVGLAMIPSSAPEPWSTLHHVCAVSLFLSIAYVSVFRASDTLVLLNDQQKIRRLKTTYRALGIGMVLSPLAAVVLTYTLDPRSRGRSLVFFVEALAVWMFAAYWLMKSRELSQTDAERLALEGALVAVGS